MNARTCGVLSSLLVTGCLCGESPQPNRIDETGLLAESSVRYEVSVRGNAVSVTVNEGIELVVCVTFSENCDLADLLPSSTRLRQHQSVAPIHMYLRPGDNTVTLSLYPDGRNETAFFTLVKLIDGREVEVQEGKIRQGDATVSFALETGNECAVPPLPDPVWLTEFLDPYPEAWRTQNPAQFAQMLLPPDSDRQSELRAAMFHDLRTHPLIGAPVSSSTLHQDHRSVPLAMNYSCDSDRLFVFPEDGGDLFIFAEIERHDRGVSTRWSYSHAAELVFHEGRWYLGRLQTP